MRYQSIVGPGGPRLHAALQQAITLGERGDCRIGQPHREHQVCKQRNERWRRRHPTPGSLSPGLIWARCWEWWWREGEGRRGCAALCRPGLHMAIPWPVSMQRGDTSNQEEELGEGVAHLRHPVHPP